tara:strand:- start:1978 stop:2490 length:513 start_codon:yes stop_codon:yes gene_type:complete
MRISKGYWIWGLFPGKDTKLLNDIKAEVQNKLKSPYFETHITLSGPYLNIDHTFLNKLKFFGESNSKIILNMDGYNFKQEIFKSFYISIKDSITLRELRKNIYELKKYDLKKNYSPHISLSYGNHDINAKKELISKLPDFRSPIRISKIALVKVNEVINSWQILKSFDLK